MALLYLVAYNIYPPIARKQSMRYNELAQELPAILFTTPTWGIPLSAFPNGTTSKLAGFVLHTVPLMLSVKQESCEY